MRVTLATATGLILASMAAAAALPRNSEPPAVALSSPPPATATAKEEVSAHRADAEARERRGESHDDTWWALNYAFDTSGTARQAFDSTMEGRGLREELAKAATKAVTGGEGDKTPGHEPPAPVLESGPK